mmetsp:Transcript_102960/g.222295  ORF Transcript_102960/g.222295 Transcript_102960/m.222295 type:complete len:98 (+) Transcript_102960:575-868(+)
MRHLARNPYDISLLDDKYSLMPAREQFRPTLVLDLDETLIHNMSEADFEATEPNPEFDRQIVFKSVPNNELTKTTIRMRPFALDFLESVSAHFEVVL